MTYYKELSHPVIVPGKIDRSVILYGWLSYKSKYRRGQSTVSYEFFRNAADKSQMEMTRGHHICEFCGWEDYNYGNGEIWIISSNKVWSAPRMVWHYIKEHEYKIPEEIEIIIINNRFKICKEEWERSEIATDIVQVPYLQHFAKWRVDRFKDLIELDNLTHRFWHYNRLTKEGDYYVAELPDSWAMDMHIIFEDDRDLFPDEIIVQKMHN
jgi:hypothetical protein